MAGVRRLGVVNPGANTEFNAVSFRSDLIKQQNAMINLQQSLLKELKQKGFINEDEYQRAELYRHFANNADFTQLPSAAKWMIDNEIIGPERSKEIIALIEKKYPDSGIARGRMTEARKSNPSHSRQKTPIIETSSVKAKHHQASQVTPSTSASTLAFEHNNRLLFQCYNDGTIDFEQYKDAYSKLKQLADRCLTDKPETLRWLKDEHIYQGKKRSSQKPTLTSTASTSRENIKIAIGLLAAVIIGTALYVSEVLPEQQNPCAAQSYRDAIAAGFNGTVTVGQPELIYLNEESKRYTCAADIENMGKQTRIIFQFTDSFGKREMVETLRYQRLPTKTMTQSERAFIDAVRRIDGNMLKQSAKSKNRGFAVFEKNILSIKGDMNRCKKTAKDSYSCPITVNYQNRFKSNSPRLSFTDFYSFSTASANQWAVSSSDSETLRKLNGSIEKAGR
jgi:hypothetical protein